MLTWIRKLSTAIRKLVAAPVFEDEEKTRVARLLNVILLNLLVTAIAVVFSIFVMFGLPTSVEEAFTISSGVLMGVVVGMLLFFARRGYVRAASVVLLSMLWTMMSIWICGMAGISSDSSTLTYLLIIVLAGLLLGGRGVVAFTLVSVLAVLGAYYAELSGLLVVEQAPITVMDPILTIANLVLAGLLLRYAVNSLLDALARARGNERAQIEANRELQTIRMSLEQRVTDRTRDLEHRSTQLQAANEVSREVTAILDPDRLIRRAVELIREQFGLYHVGLYLIDETGEWAVLRAATGAAGQAMLAREHRVRVGEEAIGWSIALALPRVALVVDEDITPLATPELPDTRSEAALPLRSRGRVLGALMVKSDRPDAFDGATVAVLETVADQVAAALDNTRLFAESQEALEAARRAYGELSRQAWTDALRARPDWGYSYARQTIAPMTGDWQPEMAQAMQTGQSVLGDGAEEPTLAIPLRVRDQVVGALGFYKSAVDEVWTPEEMAVLETMADRLGVALEGAHLYADTQRRAARDRLISEIADKMRRAPDMESLLQITVQEMAAIWGTSNALVQLSVPPGSAADENDNSRR